MRKVTISTTDVLRVINVGRRGETNATEVVFDLTPIISEFGDGRAALLVKRTHTEDAYTVTTVRRIGTDFIWRVSDLDTAIAGTGKCELWWYVDEVLAKTIVWHIYVQNDIGDPGQPPEPYEEWLAQLTKLATDAITSSRDSEAWAVGTRDGEPVDPSDPAYENNSKWWAENGHGGGELENDLVVSNPLGKYAMDDVIESGTGFETIFRGILSKTYYPNLTDPYATLTYNAAALVKVGSVVSGQHATIMFNRGSINPQYTAESNYRAGEATQYRVALVGASIAYNDSGANNDFVVPAFTRNMQGNVVLTGYVDYAEGVQPKDSDGADYQSPLPAGSKSASKTIEFILPFYWGKSAAAAITSLSGLTEDLSKKGQKTYTYANADDEYLYIAYDAAYGNLAHITDELNYENINVWQKSELAFEGHNYIVYRSAFAITGSPALERSRLMMR